MTSTFYDIEQNSDEWFNLRLGVPTSSNFAKIMANEDKSFGDPAKKYAVRLALEAQKKERIDEDDFKSEWMESGTENEPIARSKYEIETLCLVSNGGFFKHNSINAGGSPDFRVNAKKLGEIKCVKYTTQNATLKRNDADPTYKWQYQGNIWLADAEQLDFVSYSPECTLVNQLFIHTVQRNDDMIKRLQKRLIDFLELVENEKNFV